mmetsp:Transcript_757/g.1997  ORF Transcript_757/g.1997 Transcript_757/m.1997 type:complete len:463 (+) Transcript_757:58-1446(+)|eukprot:CAMPEP_0173465934 /NCGR_PEP_ID=MMETSP1357-20121228/72426_1 /TAXON_ID=77926 /ORGANISM="Hemiselmis rufescens, Strain PCC563" /LENGTH=462 /DNA_ID=CAMNT_0014433945 /DNA_START=40 /DNA_END=1428 /DNA_ORIENTATION=-
MGDSARGPPKSGTSTPRQALDGKTGTMSRQGTAKQDTAQELKMLNWYKLANEAAMKAALVKHKRFKDVPRYNPAAERVRQRATWLEAVIAEEQNKPLELEEQAYKQLMKKEEAAREAAQQRTVERHEKIVKLKDELQAKENRRLKYRKFLAQQDSMRKQALNSAGGVGSIYGPDEEPEVIEMSADVMASLHSLEQLEERVASIITDEQAKAPGSIVLDLAQAKDVGVSTVRNSSTDTLNAEQITFIKRRTEPRLGQPSQVYYTAKVVPSSEKRREAVQARNTFFALDVPERVMMQMQDLEKVREVDTLKSRESARARRQANSPDGKPRTLEDVKAQNRAERAQQAQAKEQQNQTAREEQDKVDEVIKEWLRGRNRRALKRDKKMRDIMRADRRFLSQLQVSKEVKGTSNPLENTMGGSGSGWTPNVGTQDFSNDDIQAKLDALSSQQRNMEKWKPKKGGVMQ